MDRRLFIGLLGSAAVQADGGNAQLPKKVYRVALVGGNGPAATFRQLSIARGFLQGMLAQAQRQGRVPLVGILDTGRNADPATHEVRSGDQSQDRQSDRPGNTCIRSLAGR